VHFSSPSGSVGQLPGLPVAVITAPVNAGATVEVNIDPSLAPWLDTNGKPYTVTAKAGAFRSGGAMWLRSVTPGGGYLPAGTVLRVNGGGFDATTEVAMDGVSIATQQLIDEHRIELTLGGATEMTAKHMTVTNGSGERQEFFTAIPSAPSASVSPFPGVFPIVPLNVSQKITANSNIPSNEGVQNGLALMNQKLEPVTVTFLGMPYLTADYSQVSVTVPPSSLYFLRLNTLSDGQVPAYSTSYYWVSASAPIRMLAWASKARSGGENVNIGVPGENTSEPRPVSLQVYPDTVTWSWQAGKAAPSAATISISPSGLPFTAASSVPWIHLSQSQSTLTLTPNLTGLTAGTYSATVTVTPVLPPNVTGLKIQSSTIHVTLTVSAAPLLTSPVCCAFMTFGPGIPPNGTPIPINSNGDPVPFTITTSGEPWLSLNLDHGTTPATLAPTAIVAGLEAGNYTAEIFVHGPNNTLSFPVNLTITSPQQPPVPQLQVTPSSLRFVLEAGTSGAPINQSLFRYTPQATFTVHVLSGGDWLITQASGDGFLSVNASAVNLAPGDYAAQIVVSAMGYTPVTVPVSLTVVPVPAPSTLRVSPAAVSLSGTAAVEQDATLNIDSTAGPALVQPSISASSSWLHFAVQSAYTTADGKFTTPATMTIYANSGQPGTFRGAITLQTTNNSVTVPVTLDANPAAAKPPQIASVVNAASGTAGALAPGEIFSIFGLGVGGTVLVNGVPAPPLYTSSGQVNAVVPYEAGTSGIARVRVDAAQVSSGEWGIPLTLAAPAIFTINASGAGAGAVLNEDYSVNSAANPAARGSVIQIFGTGQGITSPASLTGAISTGAGNAAVLPVKATIGGIEAIVQYQGAAPGLIAGALQVNALVPPDVTPGAAVPLSISVGGLPSQPGVTIAVR
jgi:uncharacterized protein (TIGR03437 family)